MKTEVSYGSFNFLSSNGYPVPNFTLSIDHNRTSAGDYLSSDMVVTLEGIVYTQKMAQHNATGGGTTSVITLFNKASGLKSSILENNGGKCIIKCGSEKIVDHSGIIRNISFKENDNAWAYTIDYTIEIGIPWVSDTAWSNLTHSGHYNVSNVQDEYRVEVMDDQMYLYNNNYLPTYRISRTLGATGKSFNSSGALYYAKEWVKNREVTAPLTGILKPSEFPLYNQTRNVSASEVDGTYTISDTFISKSGSPWIDTRTINSTLDNNFIRQVEINGKIQGLQPATGILYSPTPSSSGINDLRPLITGINNYKYENAVSGYAALIGEFYNIAKNYADLSISNWHGVGEGLFNHNDVFSRPINPIPISVIEGLNPTEGSISYTRIYNSRPLSLISGALSETINIRESKPTLSIVPIFVIGRRLGPVISSNTFASGIGVRTVAYEGVFPRATGLKGYQFSPTTRDEINLFVSGLKPSNSNSIIKEDSETLNLTENRLSRTISWEYTQC